MTERNFLAGLTLISVAGALILVLNQKFSDILSILFVAGLSLLAVLTLVSLANKRKAYALMILFFTGGLTFAAFTFLNHMQSLPLWILSITNLLGFAVVVSSPVAPVPKRKVTSKKRTLAKQLGTKKKKPKVVIERKKRRKTKKK